MMRRRVVPAEGEQVHSSCKSQLELYLEELDAAAGQIPLSSSSNNNPVPVEVETLSSSTATMLKTYMGACASQLLQKGSEALISGFLQDTIYCWQGNRTYAQLLTRVGSERNNEDSSRTILNLWLLVVSTPTITSKNHLLHIRGAFLGALILILAWTGYTSNILLAVLFFILIFPFALGSMILVTVNMAVEEACKADKSVYNLPSIILPAQQSLIDQSLN